MNHDRAIPCCLGPVADGAAGQGRTHRLDRRRWLTQTLALAGGGLLLTAPGARLALAAAGGTASSPTLEQRRLVVVMLRGALDGLAAVPPVGDPDFSMLRPGAGAATANLPGVPAQLQGPPLGLDGRFALHPGLAGLHRWYGEGQLAVVHAVASPYRERSHFDAQQLLESGGQKPFELSTGWLGRAMAVADKQGVALAPSLPVAMRGAPGATSWAPSRLKPANEDLLDRIAQMYQQDPSFGAAFNRARTQSRGVMGDAMAGDGGYGAGFADLARQAGKFLATDGGPPVAWLESSGWDTHTQQAGRLARMLPNLDQGLSALREALGERWRGTTVLVLTEFGRSAAMNGSGGTDHGTAGVAFVAGGEVHGGRVLANWPGLAGRDLFEARDLRPTLDMRALLRSVVQRQFGIDSRRLLRDVLPGAPGGVDDLWRV